MENRSTSVSENVQKKKLSFGTCLKKQFVRKKTKVLFLNNAPRTNGNERIYLMKLRETIMKLVFLIAACCSVLAVALICIFLFMNGVPAILKSDR